jgi:hypothetical protein
MGRFLLTQMASVAELEAGLVSERTKAALAAAKARGVKLGNPNGARALRGRQVGNKQAVAAVRANAGHRAANLRAIVDDLRSHGFTSVRAIAAQLNERGVLTARGGSWHPTSAARLLSRLQSASEKRIVTRFESWGGGLGTLAIRPQMGHSLAHPMQSFTEPLAAQGSVGV